ncbi:MAG: hypothetical protein AB8G11_04920 [Saprospiraceae bacterium]
MSIDKKLKNAREKAMNWVSAKGYSSIKATFDDEFNDPKAFISDGEAILPAITAESETGKSYFDIAQKTSHKQKLITKWKLFSILAKRKNGQFVIFAPHGHKTFTERIIDNYKISAKVISI